MTVFSGSRTIAPNIPAQRKAEIAEVLGEVLIDEPIVHIDKAWDIVVDKVYGGQEPKNGTKKQLREIIGAIASGEQCCPVDVHKQESLGGYQPPRRTGVSTALTQCSNGHTSAEREAVAMRLRSVYALFVRNTPDAQLTTDRNDAQLPSP